MAHFIETSGGWTNADHVAEVRQQQGPKPGWVLYGPDGKSIGVIPYRYTIDAAEALVPVIPAAAGATAVVIYTDGPAPGDRPTETLTEREPIIGWRLTEGARTPVLIEDPASNGIVLILLPDGRVTETYVTTYDNIAAAEAGVLRDAQDQWDREHADPKAPPG